MAARNNEPKFPKGLKAAWLLALLLTAWALFSPWGAIRHYSLSNELSQVKADLLELKAGNLQLKAEVDNLTTNPAHIEKVARERHGLLKTNEFIYLFPDDK